MSVLLPLDDNGHPMTILGFDYRGTQKVVVGDTSARNETPIASDIEVVTLLATGPCRFEFGDQNVTADQEMSPFLAPMQYLDVPLRRGEQYVAFVAEDQPCTAYVIGRI